MTVLHQYTVGTNSRQYPDPETALAAILVLFPNLTTFDVAIQFNCYLDNGATWNYSSAVAVDGSGFAGMDQNHYIKFVAVTSPSNGINSTSPLGNPPTGTPLKFNAALGVSITQTSNHTTLFSSGSNQYFYWSGFQFYGQGGGDVNILLFADNCFADQCIIWSGSVGASSNNQITRCLFYFNQPANPNASPIFCHYSTGLVVIGNTFVCPSGVTTTFWGIDDNSNTTGTFKDNAVFNFGGGVFASGASWGNISYVATDAATVPGSGVGNVTSLFYTSQFGSTTTSVQDFRPATGNGMQHGIQDLTYNQYDLTGTLRATTPTMGAYEFIVVASGIPPGLNGVLQYDWSNPRGPQQLLQAQPNLGVPTILTTLRGQDKLPFRQKEWPVPSGPESRNVAILSQPRLSLQTTTLVGKDQFFGAPGEVLDYSWPLPIGPPSSLSALLTQPLGSASVLKVTPKPFNLNNQPNPAVPPLPVQTQPLGSFPALLPTGTKPFNQSNWPVPPGALQPTQTQPLGTPAPFVLPTGVQPFSQTSWSVPAGPLQPVQTQPLGTPEPFVLPTGGKPFGQTDWPLPRAPQPPIQTQPLGVFSGLFKTPAPFFLTEWPVPRGNPPPTQTQPLGTPGTGVLPAGIKPFALSDWPVPPGPKQPVQTQPLGTYRNLTPLPPPPFFLTEQPLPPRGPLQPTQTQPLGTSTLLTLLPGQDSLPFRQRDWPVPPGPLQPTQTQPLGTFPPLFIPYPFSLTDWPVPRGPQQPTQTQPLGSFGYLIAVPFFQTNWPNPRGPLQPTQTQPLGSYWAISYVPFFQTNWPNPRGPLQPTQTQRLGSTIAFQPPPFVAPPFYQTNWPNPRGPLQPTQTQFLGTRNTSVYPATLIFNGRYCATVSLNYTASTVAIYLASYPGE